MRTVSDLFATIAAILLTQFQMVRIAREDYHSYRDECSNPSQAFHSEKMKPSFVSRFGSVAFESVHPMRYVCPFSH